MHNRSNDIAARFIVEAADLRPDVFEESLQDAIASTLPHYTDEQQADLYARVVERVEKETFCTYSTLYKILYEELP